MVTSKYGATFICTHSRYSYTPTTVILTGRVKCNACGMLFNGIDALSKSRQQALAEIKKRNRHAFNYSNAKLGKNND